MIRDLYDNSITACKTGTEQTIDLVLDTICLAKRKEKKKVAAELQLHGDQCFQSIFQAYFKSTKRYGIIPSMSKRGNCYANVMVENFSLFSRLNASTGISQLHYFEAMIRSNVTSFSTTANGYNSKPECLRLRFFTLVNIPFSYSRFFVLSAKFGAVHRLIRCFLCLSREPKKRPSL